jgi:hypothetical protein
MFQSNVEKIRTCILGSILFYENHAIYEIEAGKYVTARQATDDIVMLHRKDVLCMLDS